MDKKICRFYAKNKCHLGMSCKFAHDLNEVKSVKKKSELQKKKNYKVNFNEDIVNLNIERRNRMIPILNISFAQIVEDEIYLFLDNKNFALIYNYVKNEFKQEQLFFNKNIKNGIYFIFKGKFGSLGEIISLAFNYFNEYTMERKSCICLKDLNNLSNEYNDLIIKISKIFVINQIYHNEKILVITYRINNTDKLRVYFLNNIIFSKSDDFLNKLENNFDEFEFKNQIEKIYNSKSL